MNLKTIAKMAGVSTATVSNVINGNSSKVSSETRERIEQIIKETDYKPSAIARSLAKRESKLIGLVVPYIGPQDMFMVNPYYSIMIAELERYVRSRDYYLILRCVSDCRSMIPLLSSWNVDGAFFLGVMENDVEDVKNGLDAPVVFLDTYASGSNIVSVGIDDYRGGYLSARYLTGKGHRKIALAIPDPGAPGVVRERYRGFSDACREVGVEFYEDDIFLTDTTFEKAISVGQEIAYDPAHYTAVATMSDVVALGVSEGLRLFGMRLPEDRSVIGFDNLPQAEYAAVRLTTVAQDFEGKARLAGDYLFRMIDGEKDLAVDEHLPIRVIERQSVADITKE